MPPATGTNPETWLDDHGDALYRYALLHLRDPHLAEDAVQETLAAALQGRESFGGNSSERTWLIGILKHKLMDIFRRQAREESLEDDDPDSGEDDAHPQRAFVSDGHWAHPLRDWGNPVQALENKRFWQALERCLDALSPRLARVFLLRELAGNESEEICRELSLSSANLWTSLHRARMSLRLCLERTWIGQPG